MNLVYKHEAPLFTISLVISLLAWTGLVMATFGLALIYIPVLLLVYVFLQSAFISWLKGTGVQITPEQFPDLNERVLMSCRALRIKTAPDAYLLHGDGLFNALATRFLGRNFIVLFSDVVDALEPHPDALNFYIGHELGHVHRNHLLWNPILWPSSVVPLLGAAYSRAREYTCDLHGLACCNRLTDACLGLAALAAGSKRWKTLSLKTYAAQTTVSGGFWMSFHELTSSYPWLVKRMEWLVARATSATPRIPRRHFLAWLLAAFVPRLGTGGAGSFVTLVLLVASVGIVAAIAIPAYQDYTARARVVSGTQIGMQVRDTVTQYVIENQAWPSSNTELGLPDPISSDLVHAVSVGESGAVTVVFAGPPASIEGKSIVFEPVVEDDQLVWKCSLGTLAEIYRPGDCAQEPFAE